MQWHGNTGHAANLMRPHACTIDDVLAFDRHRLSAMGNHQTADPAPVGMDRIHPRMFNDGRPHRTRTLGKCQRDIGRIGLAILLDPDSPGYIADFKMRIAVLRLGGRNLLDRHAIGARHRGIAIELFLALGSQRHRYRTGGPHAGRNTGFCFQVQIKIGGIFGESRHVGGGPQLPDQSGSMPGRAAGQLLALQEHDVLPAKSGEMIGHRTARHAPTNDDNTRFLRKRTGHETAPFQLFPVDRPVPIRSRMKFSEKISFFKKKRKQIFEAQVPWPLGIRDRTALFQP